MLPDFYAKVGIMHVSTGTAVLVLAIYALAVMRITRLINADKIADRLRLYPATKVREATVRKYEAMGAGLEAHVERAEAAEQRWAGVLEFVQCPWCVGWWAALAAAPLPVWAIGWPWWAVPGVALACSHLVGVCARFADTEEITIQDAASGETG